MVTTPTRSFDLRSYWDARYSAGRDSGAGSRGPNAIAKAHVINRVVERFGVRSVTDWGCGDGQVLAHVTEAIDYLGVDLSPAIVGQLLGRFPKRRFAVAPRRGAPVPVPWTAELGLSLDVLFHLVHDEDLDDYLDRLFGTSTRLVLIYAPDHAGGRTARHVLWRHWTPLVAERFPEWALDDEVHGQAGAATPTFWLYRRQGVSA